MAPYTVNQRECDLSDRFVTHAPTIVGDAHPSRAQFSRAATTRQPDLLIVDVVDQLDQGARVNNPIIDAGRVCNFVGRVGSGKR